LAVAGLVFAASDLLAVSVARLDVDSGLSDEVESRASSPGAPGL
jgi:hypothetical protein